MVPIKDEHWITLQGKRFPTYPGVLLAAHESGLLGIEVSVLQYPAAENGNTAVCQAIVTMKGEDGRELIFQEIADANPGNVNRMIAPHLLRMAATRAKGRALRDALALGQALFEELGPEAHESNSDARSAVPRARHNPEDHVARTPAETAPGAGGCTVCGREVPGPTATAARKRWGDVLCLDHGKERMAQEKQTPAQLQGA